MPKLKKRFIVIALLTIATLGWFSVFSGKYTIPVLMYHEIEDAAQVRSDAVSPQKFQEQMAFLKNNGYHVLTLDQFTQALRTGKTFSRKAVVLTFDDGHKNNVTAAYPVLEKYGLTAAFFVSPGTVGQDGVMTWQDILTLHKGGMTIGSHGMRQAYLPEVSEVEQTFEIFESKAVLEKMLKDKVKYYAYPVGGYTDQLKRLIRDVGYEAAFTTNRGSDRFNKDLFEINRIKVSEKDSLLTFKAKVSGYYNLFRRLKKAN